MKKCYDAPKLIVLQVEEKDIISTSGPSIGVDGDSQVNWWD